MSIEACLIPEHSTIETLSRRFGGHMLTVESRIYDCMAQFCAAYSGGYRQLLVMDGLLVLTR
jgi:hypothetical protein